MKEKILVILPVIPYPLNAGGSIGAFNMLKAISHTFEVHLWFMIRQGREFKKRLDEFDAASGHRYKIHYTVKEKGRNRQTAVTIHEKFDNIFLKNDVQHQHDMMFFGPDINSLLSYQNILDINRVIAENNIRIVQMEFVETFNLSFALPEYVKKVIIHHELLFVRLQRRLEDYPHKTSYDEYRCRKCRADEVSALNNVDCVITLSENDKQVLATNGVTSRIESSPLFIPTTHGEYPLFKSSKQELVFLASGNFVCNTDGLSWFLKEVHPLLFANYPSYHLTVVGSKWENFINGNSIPSNLSFTGFVEDLTTVMPGKILIVPILSGSGMRMKILESVNNSIPFVSTYVGAEGMGFHSGEDCYIVDEPEQFAASIVSLFESIELQKKFVVNARTHYDQSFSPEILGKKRVAILESVLKEGK